jgi:MgtE intracellular N domain
MDSPSPLDSTQFLQQQLQAVVELLEKQELENTLVRKSTSSHHDLEEVLVNKQHQVRIQEKLSDLHPADIAFILESLPLDQRQLVWHSIKADSDGQVLLEVSDAVRQTLISGMEAEAHPPQNHSFLSGSSGRRTHGFWHDYYQGRSNFKGHYCLYSQVRKTARAYR